MPRNRNSRRQTAYLGVQAATPPNLTRLDRPPTVNDSIGYRIGALWLVSSPEEIWMLVNLSQGIATWVQLYPGAAGGATEFPCNVGTANEAGGILNVLGDAVAITTTGAGNTITISPTGAIATQYTADTGTAMPSLGNLNVLGGELINTAASGSTVTINLDRGLNGQVPIAATGAPTIYANITSLDGSVTVTNGANTIDLATLGSGGTMKTLTGNTGGAVSPLAGNTNTVGNNANGLTVVGNPGTHTLTVDTVGGHPVGQSLTGDAGGAVFFDASGNINTVGAHGINTLGNPGANSMTVAINNNITLGDLSVITAGNDALTVTSGNITLSGTGANAAGNINIPNTSSDGRQGVITFNGSRFISNFGITNTFVGANSGSLLNTGVGSGANTALGTGALAAISDGGNGASFNVAVGTQAMANYTFTTTGGVSGGNTALGATALFTLTTGGLNTAVGNAALQDVTTGAFNTAVGAGALPGLTTGQRNIAIGHGTGANSGGGTELISGSYNILIGEGTGGAYNAAESSNILLSNTGVIGESNVIRLGTTGSSDGQQNKAFIAGVRGVTTANANAIPVLIDSAGQLGTVSSSERYKENIKDLGDKSSFIYDLKPKTFNYKSQPEDKSVGLIAEEVEKVAPELVIYTKGQAETVAYQDLPIYMLNEMKRLKERLDALEASCTCNKD